MKLLRLTLVIAAVACLTEAGRAQSQSGPATGEKVAALKVHAVTGSQAEKELDYAAERKDKPTIYVLIQADKWDRPVARFLKTLDGQVAKTADDAAVVAVWLTDDVDKAKEYLPRAQQSLNLEHTVLTVFAGDKGGPQGWSLNLDATATAVVVREGKVVASFGYRSVNETDVRKVLAALKK
jgi:hypothetical protein